MAVRRKIGNLAQFLLQSHLRSREDEYQSSLTAQRQREIAEFNDRLRRAQAEDQRQHSLLTKGLEDPALMEQFSTGGIDVGVDPNRFKPTDDKILAQLSAKIGAAKREELPTDLGVESQLGATPWGSQLAKDPRAVKQGMIARDDRRTALDEIDAYQTDLKGADAFASAYGTGMGTESAAAASFPAQLDREKTQFSAMTPLEVGRESKKAWATLPAEMAKQRSSHLLQVERDRTNREAELLKLPPTIAEKVAGIDASLYSLDKLELIFNTQGADEQVGPVAGRLGRLGQQIPLLPTDPEFNTFLAETTTLQNSIIKAITGAQMSEPEAKRIMGQVPSEKDKPDVWKAKALATRQNMIMLRNRQLELVNAVEPNLEVPTALSGPPLPDVDPATQDAIKRLRALRQRRPF